MSILNPDTSGLHVLFVRVQADRRSRYDREQSKQFEVPPDVIGAIGKVVHDATTFRETDILVNRTDFTFVRVRRSEDTGMR